MRLGCLVKVKAGKNKMLSVSDILRVLLVTYRTHLLGELQGGKHAWQFLCENQASGSYWIPEGVEG